jgi:hypothetical protein
MPVASRWWLDSIGLPSRLAGPRVGWRPSALRQAQGGPSAGSRQASLGEAARRAKASIALKSTPGWPGRSRIRGGKRRCCIELWGGPTVPAGLGVRFRGREWQGSASMGRHSPDIVWPGTS